MTLKFYWRRYDQRRRLWPRVTSPIWFMGGWHPLDMRRGFNGTRVDYNAAYLALDDIDRPMSVRFRLCRASRIFVRKWSGPKSDF